MIEGISKRREYGEAIISRAGKLKKTPAAMASALARFKRAHGEYEAAAVEADRAIVTRDKLLAVLSIADVGVDTAVITMGHRMVGAEMTPPNSPFKGFARFAPTELVGMKCSDEYREVAKLLVKVDGAKGLQAPVKNAARDAKNKLAVANKALGALTTPQTKVTEALQSRESLVAEWESALHSVRIQAAAAWETTPAKLKALLAPVNATQRGTKKRVTTRKAKPRKKATPVTPPAAV